MEQINKHIKTNEFAKHYLIYGSEEFLKNQYKNKLEKALVSEGDDINLAKFEGDSLSVNEVISIASTMPFFADRRVIIIKNSGWFKTSCELAEYIEAFPETTCIVFVENEVDRRNKLFKYVSENGYATRIEAKKPEDLMGDVAKTLARRGLRISNADCNLFITKTGTDMARIQAELDKLCAYCLGKDSVTRNDIETICSEIPEGKVFLMIDAMLAGNSERALQLYYQLLAAQEKAMSILFMLVRSYNQFFQVLSLNKKGFNKSRIAAELGVKDFVVDKYVRLSGKYNIEEIRQIVEYGTELEEKIKQGNMDERIAVEIFIVKFSKM